MDQKKITKQMMEFNKIVFNDNFYTMNALYEHTERLINKFWEKSPILSEEGRKFTSEWTKNYKTGCDNFKNAVNKNFE
ncbi:MAG: hypothetical protein ABFD66_07265 [Smithella sp.]